jgi:hypothetical protein
VIRLKHLSRSEATTLVISAAALAVSFFSLSEVYQARLMERRSQLRTEALELMHRDRQTLTEALCYSSFTGMKQPERESLSALYRSKDLEMRRRLSALNIASQAELDLIDSSFNITSGVQEQDLRETISSIRLQLDAKSLNDADKRCRSDG